MNISVSHYIPIADTGTVVSPCVCVSSHIDETIDSDNRPDCKVKTWKALCLFCVFFDICLLSHCVRLSQKPSQWFAFWLGSRLIATARSKHKYTHPQTALRRCRGCWLKVFSKMAKQRLYAVNRLQIDSHRLRSLPRSLVCDRHYLLGRHVLQQQVWHHSRRCRRRRQLHFTSWKRTMWLTDNLSASPVCVFAQIHFPKLVYKMLDVSKPFYNVFLDLVRPQDCSTIFPQCMHIYFL